MAMALSGCFGEKEAGTKVFAPEALDISVTPERERGEELHELVVLLLDDLAKKEARIAKLEHRLDVCDTDLQGMREIVPAGGTGAPLLELPQELALRKLRIIDPDGEAVLTFEERAGKAFISIARGAETFGPVPMDPILSVLIPRPKGKGMDVPDEFSTWIRKIGPYEYLVLKSGLDTQLSNLDTLARQARVIPHYKDGVIRGLKLVGVRPGSPYRAIGIRSGDVIMTVNGDEISSADRALDLYKALADVQTVVVGVLRRGKELAFTYHIVASFPETEAENGEPSDSTESTETAEAAAKKTETRGQTPPIDI